MQHSSIQTIKTAMMVSRDILLGRLKAVDHSIAAESHKQFRRDMINEKLIRNSIALEDFLLKVEVK
jgi:hypothetical protein